jgi:hypothetical protein
VPFERQENPDQHCHRHYGRYLLKERHRYK